MKSSRIICFTLLLVLLFSTIGQGQPISAVATFSIIADFVSQVGGDEVEVVSLVPTGADPHSWEPTPQEARTLAHADIVFANGEGFEMWIDDLIAGTIQADVHVHILSEGLIPIKGHSHNDHSHNHDHSHTHYGDPHFWLSVPNAVHYVEKIAEALSELVPEKADLFYKQAESYIADLWELDNWLLEQIASIPQSNRVLLTYHNTFAYFAERYGFTVTDFLVNNPEREPSARELAELIQVMSTQEKPVIFLEPQFSAAFRYGETLASEVGGRIEMLHSESISAELPTYLDMMYYNGTTIVEALQ